MVIENNKCFMSVPILLAILHILFQCNFFYRLEFFQSALLVLKYLISAPPSMYNSHQVPNMRSYLYLHLIHDYIYTMSLDDAMK